MQFTETRQLFTCLFFNLSCNVKHSLSMFPKLKINMFLPSFKIVAGILILFFDEKFGSPFFPNLKYQCPFLLTIFGNKIFNSSGDDGVKILIFGIDCIKLKSSTLWCVGPNLE